MNNTFIILDEGQNTTVTQMKMFLTRMGHGSRIVVTGDTTQIDLPSTSTSGLIDAVERLRHIPGVGVDSIDRRRHRPSPRWCAGIVAAYDADRKSRKRNQRRVAPGANGRCVDRTSQATPA